MTAINSDFLSTSNTVADGEEWLTRAELAKRWKKSTATLATWAVKGIGPRYALIGRSARYNLRDVIAFERLAYCEAAKTP